jgi:hypothetical protein
MLSDEQLPILTISMSRADITQKGTTRQRKPNFTRYDVIGVMLNDVAFKF